MQLFPVQAYADRLNLIKHLSILEVGFFLLLNKPFELN